MPRKRGGVLFMRIKNLRLSLILRGAKVILANDRVTQSDIQTLTGRSAILIPYVVDGAFFQFSQPRERGEFILVPGNNDRDEDLVLAIARSGVRIVRVTVEPKVVAHYRSADTAGIVDVRYKVGYGELRTLYQKARVVALPLKTRNHSAGQTALLEAVVAGAPIVISRGRVSEEVQYLKSVIACEGNQVYEWLTAFGLARDILVSSPNVLRNCSMRISETHSPSSVRKQLVEILRAVSRERLNCA
jgi:hypothetical protein